MTYIRIEDDSYAKLQFHLRTQVTAILNVFDCYGMGLYIPQATEECVKLAENFGMAVRGKNIPIDVLDKPKERGI